MEKILCCINDSDHAMKAAGFAKRLSGALGASLVFLVVNELKPASGYSPIEQYRPAEIREPFKNLRIVPGRPSGTVEQVSMEAFDVSKAILDYATKENCTHIVVGTGNPPFLTELLLGSVSKVVVAKAPCTVTVVR